MFNKSPRDNKYIADLQIMLIENYNFSIELISEAKRGFFGETWKVTTNTQDYFVKIDYWDYHKHLYRNSFTVIDFILQNGINFIPKIIKTKNGELFCYFNQGIVGVFEFIDGQNTEDYPIESLFDRLAKIYKIVTDNLRIEIEAFDMSIIDNYLCLKNEISDYDNQEAKQVIELLTSKNDLLKTYEERLELFSRRCIDDRSNFHITHGDAGGNCIINGETLTIIDWDYPKLAPPERDAWFFINNNDLIGKICNIINYDLKIERLCYYCYYSFFYYLAEYLKAYIFVESIYKKDVYTSLISYFDSCWIFKQLSFADGIY